MSVYVEWRGNLEIRKKNWWLSSLGKFQSMIICNMQKPGCTPSKQCIDIKMGISLLYDMIHTVRWCYTFWNFQATDEGTRRDYSELLKCDKKLRYSILVFWNNRTYQLHKKCYYKAVASRSCLFTFTGSLSCSWCFESYHCCSLLWWSLYRGCPFQR